MVTPQRHYQLIQNLVEKVIAKHEIPPLLFVCQAEEEHGAIIEVANMSEVECMALSNDLVQRPDVSCTILVAEGIASANDGNATPLEEREDSYRVVMFNVMSATKQAILTSRIDTDLEGNRTYTVPEFLWVDQLEGEFGGSLVRQKIVLN